MFKPNTLVKVTNIKPERVNPFADTYAQTSITDAQLEHMAENVVGRTGKVICFSKEFDAYLVTFKNGAEEVQGYFCADELELVKEKQCSK